MNKIFKKSNSNNLEKIILNKKSDLINIPIQQLRTAQLKNFSGSLFEQIYKEAILIEKNQANKIKKQLLESKEHSRSFASKMPKEIINKNIEDYYNGEKNKAIKIINKKANKEIKDDKIEIDSIIFEIKYDTEFGEEIGILGSNIELGNWDINNIFYLKWNEGNIWKGKIDINKPYNDFEFKFIISQNRKIKRWENGDNNKIYFDSILNEIKYKNSGYLNNYEYYYNKIEKELYLKCKWH